MDSSDREVLVQAEYPFKARLIKVLSILQIVIGCLCTGINIALLVIFSILPYYTTHSYYGWTIGCKQVGYGIWCGVFYIVTASFGLVSARTSRIKYIGTFCILSSVTTLVFVVPIFTFGGVTLRNDANFADRLYEYDHGYWVTNIVLDSSLLFFALLEFWFSLWSAIVSWIYIKRNFLKEPEIPPEAETSEPRQDQPPSGWFVMTSPDGQPQLINSSQISVYQGEPLRVRVMPTEDSATSEGVYTSEREDIQGYT